MAEPSPTDITHLAKLVAWIDEQRNQDKEQSIRLSQQVERLAADLREVSAHVLDVQDRLRQSQNALAHLAVVDSALKQGRDQVGELQRQFQEIEKLQNRHATAQQAESARLAKAAADLAQQIADLYKLHEEGSSLVQRNAEEIKRDRATAAPLPQRIDHVERQSAVIAGKVQLLEELRKRDEGQAAGLQQASEEIRAEQKRLWQWQQTAEVRWARQLAEWAQQIEQWQHLIDEQVRVIQEMARDTAQTKDSIQASQRELAEQREHLADYLSDLRRLESMLGASREDSHRMEQSMDLQRRRIDEQAGNLREVDERLRQSSSDDDALTRRLDHERGRIDELAIALRLREQEQRADRGDLGNIQEEMHSVRYDLDDGLARLRQEMIALGQRQRERIAAISSVHQRFYLRHITDLEQQVRELQEQDAPDNVAIEKPEK